MKNNKSYYNENDPFAAAWLRELIKGKHIADGVVDERSIEDITPSDIRGFSQCHFFAGIGVWSYALRLAGWPDDRPVWTGSCPCQPFSAAGKRKGTSDERHLWPAWQWLIKELRPRVIFGEQVASKDGISWLDLVSTDLEGEGYAVAPLVLPACGVGSPNKRERLWFVADSSSQLGGLSEQQKRKTDSKIIRHSKTCNLANPAGDGWKQWRPESVGRGTFSNSELGDTDSEGLEIIGVKSARTEFKTSERAGPVNGFWADAEWLECTDGKSRPTKPGLFPLAHGVAGRVGKLRGYGNAINAQAAKEFIMSAIELL